MKPIAGVRDHIEFLVIELLALLPFLSSPSLHPVKRYRPSPNSPKQRACGDGNLHLSMSSAPFNRHSSVVCLHPLRFIGTSSAAMRHLSQATSTRIEYSAPFFSSPRHHHLSNVTNLVNSQYLKLTTLGNIYLSTPPALFSTLTLVSATTSNQHCCCLRCPSFIHS